MTFWLDERRVCACVKQRRERGGYESSLHSHLEEAHYRPGLPLPVSHVLYLQSSIQIEIEVYLIFPSLQMTRSVANDSISLAVLAI